MQGTEIVGAGDTDLTWQAFVAAMYKINNKWQVAFGYRYLDWEFDDDEKGGGTFNDLNISGPILGAEYLF